jgi:hypothetical protein
MVMEESGSVEWMGKFRVLTTALIVSGALNIGLIAAFAASSLRERAPLPAPAPFSPVSPPGGESGESVNVKILASFSRLSFPELAACLTNRDLVEEGYLKRDLALAALVSFHHFALEKALGSLPQQVRTLPWGEGAITLYPGLSEEQFKAVVEFAYTEKWPLTARGLFLHLQKKDKGRDPTLIEAFAHTAEFSALQQLFQKSGAPQESGILIDLIAEGNWDLIERFTQEQAQMLDLSVEKRRRLLLSYLSLRSATAAEILIKTDRPFIGKKLDDRGLLDLLGLIRGKSEEAEKLCLELLRSPRGDAVWAKAVGLLYAFAGEPLPSPFSLEAALARFVPSPSAPAPAVKTDPAPAAKPERVEYVVQSGDSLWKIARKHKVSVDQIVAENRMEKERIYPGMVLKIPARSTP